MPKYVYLTRQAGERALRTSEEIVAGNLGYYRLIGDVNNFGYQRVWVASGDPATDLDADRFSPTGGHLPTARVGGDGGSGSGTTGGGTGGGTTPTPTPTPIGTRRTTEASKIPWETRRFLPTGADLEAGKYGPILGDGSILLDPLNISWPIPGEPTVNIPGGYTRLLRFKRWNIQGGGSFGGTGRSGMVNASGGNRLELDDNMFFAMPPKAGYAGAWRARALVMYSLKKLILTNNLMPFTSGVYLDGYSGSAADDGVYAARNQIENVDGRYWNNDGSLNQAEDNAGKERVQALQVNNCWQIPYLAEDNYVVKDLYSNSECEDVFSSAASTPLGTGINRRFLVRGISCYDPLLTPTRTLHGLRNDGSERNYNGGPGLAGDLGAYQRQTPTRDNVPHNWEFHDYLSLGGSSSYCGPSISSGNRSALRRGTVYSPGVARSSTSPLGFVQYGRTGASYIIDYGTGNAAGIWGDHIAEDLTLGIFAVRKSLDGQNYSASGNYNTPAWFPKNYVNFGGAGQGTNITRNITALPKPTSIAAALDEEDRLAKEWFDGQTAAGRVIGCRL